MALSIHMGDADLFSGIKAMAAAPSCWWEADFKPLVPHFSSVMLLLSIDSFLKHTEYEFPPLKFKFKYT